jgi:hypothetical protein
MIFTKAQVEKIKDAYQKVSQYDTMLTDFFQPIIQELGWTNIDNITVHANEVAIKVSWYGPYQSENHDIIYCPNHLLTKTHAEVILALKEIQCTE